LFGEDNSANNMQTIVTAQHTLSLQFPKMAFLFPENEKYAGNWHLLDICLHPDAINEMQSPYCFIEKEDIQAIIKKRSRFSHKGVYGHALFIGGSYGKMGAAVLASKACLRTGAGLLSVRSPECGAIILQISVPEAMCLPDNELHCISSLPQNLDIYSATGIGCGMGTEKISEKVIEQLLQSATQPLILDADALNILSKHPDWLDLLPENTILTPHPKEFERSKGTCKNRWEQIEKAQNFRKKYSIFIVLKGAYTAVVCPDGNVHFNSTGNAGMATGGSGDALCGIILSLLAQGYSPKESALLGVYLHGAAGDYAIQRQSEESLIASDIINCIGCAFKNSKMKQF
jgi:NAD(P)H-hydrate epimerase